MRLHRTSAYDVERTRNVKPYFSKIAFAAAERRNAEIVRRIVLGARRRGNRIDDRGMRRSAGNAPTIFTPGSTLASVS